MNGFVGVVLIFVLQIPHATPQFLQLVEKLEADVLELRTLVEEVYQDRCDTALLAECEGSNYDDCDAQFPNPTCPVDGSNQQLKDFTISVIRVPEILQDGIDGNPTDPKAIESICYGSRLDEYFQSKEREDREYWENLGAPSPQRYFGSNSGPFRIYPGRYSENCRDYDPRVRPWFVAASSGPKNVLLVVDVSGSMLTDDRITAMKQAATVIVNTLTATDRVALVAFSNTASIISDRALDGSQVMFEATTENKVKLVEAIDRLEASGSTNFMAAFDAAFQVFEQTAEKELTRDCTTAVLFLTDGQMTHPTDVSEDEVLSRILEQIKDIEAKVKNPVFLFTYSVSFDDELVHEFPKRLACSSRDGVWSRIGEATEILDSLVGYSHLLALGLGEEQNEDFTAWVEPYKFSSGIWGVTVSAPVYDRSKSPPLFVGVVGVDNTLEVFNRLLQEDGEDATFLESIVKRSSAKCPRLDNIPSCVLESYRRQGRAGDQALCSANCSESFSVIEEQACPAVSDYPQQLLNNNDKQGQSFRRKQCSQRSMLLIGVLGLLAGFFLVALITVIIRQRKAANETSNRPVDLRRIPPLTPPAKSDSTRSTSYQYTYSY